MQQLPKHLQKYIVQQDYQRYTPIDHACWRFILRQLKAFLRKHAHESYEQGLEKTGVEVERIPRISDISSKLEKFGWRALPVSGFIPPAAFMELQSLSVLPIASDMRSIDHLLYTPAPDIVHEAAGHAPILADPEFAQYLREYAQVASKAIISSEDLDLYEKIRLLSDLKEHPDSTTSQIDKAQAELDHVAKSMTHVSEAAELSRMNWWTAEYGLVGDLRAPKIYGAGLLSSVGESKMCLDPKVKKIPLSVDCIKTSYDITEPQPQLFVARDFRHLTEVLHDFAKTMAFQQGGAAGLAKAQQAKAVTTVQLNSGLQISGVLAKYSDAYLQWSGPCQLSCNDHELAGHDKKYHAQGFGSPLGFWKQSPNKCASELSDAELVGLGVTASAEKPVAVKLEFTSGVQVHGQLKKITRHQGKLVLLSFVDCEVRQGSQILFAKEWGTFDMAVGSRVTSVFGGPADRVAYGDTTDFQALKVRPRILSEQEQRRGSHFQQVRDLREGQSVKIDLQKLCMDHLREFPQDWLLVLEAYELTQAPELLVQLENLKRALPAQAATIQDGINQAKHLTL